MEPLLTVNTQWNGVVKLLPLWLAPNMVTLLGFFAIMSNVVCLVIFMPDMVGPVRRKHLVIIEELPLIYDLHNRRHHGCTIASPSAYGSTRQWTILMGNKHGELVPPVLLVNSLITASTLSIALSRVSSRTLLLVWVPPRQASSRHSFRASPCSSPP